MTFEGPDQWHAPATYWFWHRIPTAEEIQEQLLRFADLIETLEEGIGELFQRFEHELAAMPNFIDTISNSSLSRIDAMHASLGPDYTHVWEQEFAALDGLAGAYMQHAYHWSVIDPWFDVQAPAHIVDPVLIHSSCDLRRSILTLA